MSDKRTEYRVVYKRNGREEWRGGFPKPDIDWASWIHNILPYEVVRWEKRDIVTSDWEPTND